MSVGFYFDFAYCFYLQRPPFFSFKIGLSSALKQAFELSLSSLVLCVLLSIFWPDHIMEGSTFGQLIIQEIRLFICISVISLHWEISRHLLEVGALFFSLV